MPTITFTSSGSWTALANVIDCQCIGEGGNGASGLHASHAGGGGGGGECAEETTLAVTNGNLYTFTIGSGGSSTSTSFPGDSVTVTAHGGSNGSGFVGGAGGTGSTNSIVFAGGHAGSGSNGTGNRGGGGGGGSAGSGSVGGTGGNGSTTVGGTGGSAGTGGGASGGNGGNPTTSGSAGNAPGGGGGGGGSTSTINGAQGFGAAGQIVIIYTSSIPGAATLAGIGTLTASGSAFNPTVPPGFNLQPGQTWLRRYARWRHTVPWAQQIQKITAGAALHGVGTMVAVGALPNPTIANQWSNSYGQGTTFTSITSALQSCVVGLNPGNSVGPGTGVPTPGNWLFTIASWTQNPNIISVHVGVGDDGHSWWREFPAAGPTGLTRTSVSYTPNITSQVDTVYVAPDGEIAAINVLVIEVAGLGPWDSLSGTNVNYTAAGTSVSLALGAPAKASFLIGATGGDNISSGQAFLPSGWLPLATQTQTNGSNALADNILTAAYLPSTVGSVSVSGTSSSSEDMSGFLISVQVSGNNPVPANQNPNWPLMIFEAGFGSGFNTPDSEITWTDLSPRLWDWSETTGIQFQLGQIQATNLTMHLDNLDGALISTNTSSPYYPNVTPGTPLRLRGAIGTMGGVTVNRWYVIQRNAAQWGEEIDEVYRRWCPVSGTDLWAALSSVPPTVYRSEIYEDAPYAWWPCDDQPGTSGVLPTFLLNAALGNVNPLNILLSSNGGGVQQFFTRSGFNLASAAPPGIATYTVGADGGWMFGDPQSSPASIEAGNSVTATPGSAAWQAAGQAGSTGSFGWYLSCNDTNFPPLSSGITVEVWFNYPFYGSAEGFAVNVTESPTDNVTWSAVLQQPYNTPFTILELATSSAPVVVAQLDTSGHLNLITYNGSTGTSHSIYTASDLRSGSWHMVTMTLTTSNWEIWLDGGANAHASGSGAGMTSAWTWLIGNADFGSGGGVNTSQIVHGGNVSLSHIAVYPYVLPYYRVLDHYWAAVTAFGQLPAPSGVQVQWVLQEYVTGTITGETFPNQEQVFAPDGTPVPNTFQESASFYGGSNGVSASAIVSAFAPGVTSGISAQATGAAAQVVGFNPAGAGSAIPGNFVLWVGWTGLAPSFNVYTGNTTGVDHEAAVVNGAGVSFTQGYGNTATVTGAAEVSGGDGSIPPTAASSIGDTVGQRIERLMRAGRVSSPNRCIDPATLLVQAPGQTGGGQQAGANVQAIQQSDSGLLYVDNQNNLTYWQRPHLASQYSSPVWQLGPTSPRIPYHKEIEWVTDPQHIYNAITVAPLSPTGASLPLITPSDVTDVEASQLRYGAQPLQVVSWLQSVPEMQNQANWLFSTFGTPQRHVEQVKIEAAGATPSTLAASWQIILGVNVGDIVQLEDWIIGGGGPVYTYRVTEIQRNITQGFGGSSGNSAPTTASVTLIMDFEPTTYWT